MEVKLLTKNPVLSNHRPVGTGTVHSSFHVHENHYFKNMIQS